MSSLKQALVATLCEHTDAEKHRQSAGIGNAHQLQEALANTNLTKADFFGSDEKSKPFLDNIKAWNNFGKIVDSIARSGEKFAYEDFMSPFSLDSKKNLLETARAFYGLDKVFKPEVWHGRYDDMEKLWYKLAFYERNSKTLKGTVGQMPLDLKRDVLTSEGKFLPEDRLADAKVSLNELRNAVVNEYSFNEVNAKLQAAGDYFRKEYAMLPDGSGDVLFDRAGSWGKYDAIVKIMQSYGEHFEVKDYLRQLGSAPSLLTRAAEQHTLNKVFTPAHWVDRLPEMLNLWSHVLDAWKESPMATQDFDNAYAAAEGLTYETPFRARTITGKADLLAPLNDATKEKPVVPLGLKVLWDNFDSVQAHLGTKGEAITLADLRTPSGHMQDTCLMSAAKFGRFDKITEIASRNNQKLTLDDFLSRDAHGNTLINVLAEKNQLKQVFTVEAWTGNIAEMRTLWSHVGAAHRKQLDYGQLETAVKQATMKQQKKGGIKIRPR